MRAVGLWLTLLVEGKCQPEDVLPIARSAGYPSFADLCLAALPERLPRLPLRRVVIRRRIEQALAGQLSFARLRAWAEELHAIAFRHVLGSDRSERRIAASALALLAVATDDSVFRTRLPVERVLLKVAHALEGRGAVPSEALYSELFVGQEELHLAARRPLVEIPGEGGEPSQVRDPSSADVLALPAPGRVRPAGATTIVAFAAVTEKCAHEDSLGRYSQVQGLIANARERAPNFAFGRYRPRVQRDVDGILELVLRTPEIDAAAVAYSAKLFALIHGIGRLTLDGKALATLNLGRGPESAQAARRVRGDPPRA